MDRRGFLKSTGAVAVAAGAGAEAAAASPIAAAAARRLTVAVEDGYERAGFGADRLARRVELASAGRLRIERAGAGEAADLRLGGGDLTVALHPGFAFFAGLPAGEGLNGADLAGWLAVGGGQPLWDELAYGFGWKPLLAGSAGDGIGLWSNARLEERGDLAEAPVAASGLVAELVAALGGVPVAVPEHRLRAALASGRLTAAEPAAPLPVVAFDLAPLAPSLYQPGLNPAGGVTTLCVARRLWDDLTPADQALLTACAAEEHGQATAEAGLARALLTQIRATAKWPHRLALPPALARAVAEAAGDVVAAAANHDAASRRIAASYRAWRALCRGAEA